MKEKEKIEAELIENSVAPLSDGNTFVENEISENDSRKENSPDDFLCQDISPDGEMSNDDAQAADDAASDIAENTAECIDGADTDFENEADIWRSAVLDTLYGTAEAQSGLDGVEIATVDDFEVKDCTKDPEDEKPSAFGEVIISPDELFSSSGITIPKSQAERRVVYETADVLVGEQISLEEIDTQSTDREEICEDIPDVYTDYDDGELPKYNPEKPRKIDKRFDLLELFVFTLLAVMIITAFLFKHSVVDGESMEGTLIDGEHLIISDLFYTPEQGDIVVCEDFTTALKKPIVKRIIATEGQTVKITRKGEVYVNGLLLVEDYVYIDNPAYEYRELYLIVPEGEVFVMGDHRNHSTDSRDIGTIRVDSILGRVILRFYPFDKFGKVE